MSSDSRKTSWLSLRRFVSKKNFILVISILAFLGAILYMQIGASEFNRFENAERPVGLRENPRSFDVPNQGTSNDTGGFNVSSDFDQLPRFDIPADVAAQLPEGFGNKTYDGLPDITTPVDPSQSENPNNEGPVIPGNIKPPTSWNGGRTIDDGQYSNGTGNSGGPPPPNTTFDPTPGGSTKVNNVTLEERSDKGRNLPKVEFIDLSFINFNSINIVNLKVNVKIKAVLFLTVLAMPVLIMNKIVPNFVKRLDEFDDNTPNINSMFVMPKRNIAALSHRKDRVKRLLVFKDHVDGLIERSRIRIELKTPSHTIIIGYHELDKAFSEFSSLIRTKDITPLEHAHKHFETGEIENEILEKIVELFYLTRFASVEISKDDGYLFIDHLDRLVLDKEKISEKLKSIEQEINENLEEQF